MKQSLGVIIFDFYNLYRIQKIINLYEGVSESNNIKIVAGDTHIISFVNYLSKYTDFKMTEKNDKLFPIIDDMNFLKKKIFQRTGGIWFG